MITDNQPVLNTFHNLFTLRICKKLLVLDIHTDLRVIFRLVGDAFFNDSIVAEIHILDPYAASWSCDERGVHRCSINMGRGKTLKKMKTI